jgi:ferredoxin
VVTPTREKLENLPANANAEGMTMRVTVDRDRCCGGGQCVLVAPDIFDQRDEDGLVELLQERPPAERHEDVRKAARICPGLAIFIHEE